MGWAPPTCMLKTKVLDTKKLEESSPQADIKIELSFPIDAGPWVRRGSSLHQLRLTGNRVETTRYILRQSLPAGQMTLKDCSVACRSRRAKWNNMAWISSSDISSGGFSGWTHSGFGTLFWFHTCNLSKVENSRICFTSNKKREGFSQNLIGASHDLHLLFWSSAAQTDQMRHWKVVWKGVLLAVALLLDQTNR